MQKSLCRLLIYVNHGLVANFSVINMSFNAIRENKILAKISGFTVLGIRRTLQTSVSEWSKCCQTLFLYARLYLTHLIVLNVNMF